MIAKIRFALALLSLGTIFTAWTAAAQSQMPFERVLIPIILRAPVPGAYGSLWATDLTARNETSAFVEVTNAPSLPCVTQPPCGHPPLTTFKPELLVDNPNGGAFFFVGAPGADKVTFNLRVFDMSRQALTWGTTIPVVRAQQTYTGKLQLLSIPTDARFRLALRVYDFDPPTGRSVRLRVYDQMTESVLVDTPLQLNPAVEQKYDAVPGTAILTDLVGAYPQIASTRIVRIDLDPITSDLRFWAFVSVTNNEAQHVTVIVPQ